MKTLKQIQVEAHALAREKGFYDDCSDPTDPTWIAARLALVHAEVSEALECVRNEDMEAYQWYDKPEGFGIELADVVLRLADLAESLKHDLVAKTDNWTYSKEYTNTPTRLARALYEVHVQLAKFDSTCPWERRFLTDALWEVQAIAESLGIDLDQMVELKMSYNHTRPNRHGGKKL